MVVESYIDGFIEHIKGKNLAVKVIGPTTNDADRHILRAFESYAEISDFINQNSNSFSRLLITEDEGLELLVLLNRFYQTSGRIKYSAEQISFMYRQHGASVGRSVLFGSNCAYIQSEFDSLRVQKELSKVTKIVDEREGGISPEEAVALLKRIEDIHFSKDVGGAPGTPVDPEKAIKHLADKFEECYRLIVDEG